MANGYSLGRDPCIECHGNVCCHGEFRGISRSSLRSTSTIRGRRVSALVMWRALRISTHAEAHRMSAQSVPKTLKVMEFQRGQRSLGNSRAKKTVVEIAYQFGRGDRWIQRQQSKRL